MRARSSGRSWRTETLEPVDRIRKRVIELAVSQGGLVTLPQIAPARAAREGRRAMATLSRMGEVERVGRDVWVHCVADRSAFDSALRAEAVWVLLDPARPAWARARRARAGGESVAVIGGGAAYQRWGFGPTTWPAELHTPDGNAVRFASLDVEVRREEVEPDDIVWFGPFPYLGVEATLAGSFAWDGDLDSVAADLADALWRLHPVDGGRLRRHLATLHRTDDERAATVEADNRWDELLRRTGRWHPQPVGGAGSAWRQNRPPSDAAIARYRAALDPERRAQLWTSVVQEFAGS